MGLAASKFHDKRLIEACKANRVVEARSALASGANPNLMDITGEPLTHTCARHGRIEILKALIASKADLKSKDRDGFTCLRKACREGWLDAAKILLDAGADIKEKDEVGDTLLHNLAARGRKGSPFSQIAALLLAKGALTTSKNERGECPLHHAARYGGARMCQLLLQAGADLAAKDLDGYSAIHAATLGLNNEEALRAILLAKADPNEREREGQTPLHLLAAKSKSQACDTPMARALISQGANVWLKDRDGLSPFERANRGRSQQREIDSALVNLLRPRGMPPPGSLEPPVVESRKKKGFEDDDE